MTPAPTSSRSSATTTWPRSRLDGRAAQRGYFHAGRSDDPEAQQFNRGFPQQRPVALRRPPARRRRPTSPTALRQPGRRRPHAIEEAVSVLEGGGDKRITKREALRMLVHFVGDITSRCTSATASTPSPRTARDARHRPGGRQGPPQRQGRQRPLLRARAATTSCTPTGTRAAVQGHALGPPPPTSRRCSRSGRGGRRRLEEPGRLPPLGRGLGHGEPGGGPGPPTRGSTFGAVTPDPKGGIRRSRSRFPPATTPPAFPIAEERLAKAGYHLAEILNAIHWAD
jgi:hypothetical protein